MFPLNSYCSVICPRWTKWQDCLRATDWFLHGVYSKPFKTQVEQALSCMTGMWRELATGEHSLVWSSLELFSLQILYSLHFSSSLEAPAAGMWVREAGREQTPACLPSFLSSHLSPLHQDQLWQLQRGHRPHQGCSGTRLPPPVLLLGCSKLNAKGKTNVEVAFK